MIPFGDGAFRVTTRRCQKRRLTPVALPFSIPRTGYPLQSDLSTRRGLQVPEHSSVVGSSIASDNEYDQIALFPGQTEEFYTGHMGIYDFDTVLFPDLWKNRAQKDFNAYMRYYISDHRPMWIQFEFPRD